MGMKKLSEGTLRQKLARFLFSYRITPQSTTGVSPAELLIGRKLRSVLDLLNPNVSGRVEAAQLSQKTTHDKRAQSRSFSLGDVVYARNYGQGTAWEKGTIVDTSGIHNFIVEVNLSGQLTRWKRHVDQLKKCYEDFTAANNQQQQTDTSSVSEGEEEEKSNESGIEIYPQQPTPRQNPPRARKPPDKLTY